MDDLISRDYLREIVGGMPTDWEYGAAVSDIYDIIMKAPAVDAVPRVSAHWRTLKDGSLECTNCFGISPHDENYNGDIICNYETDYCPWCGAKMDGGAES